MCENRNHWEDILIFGACITCHKTLSVETERTVDDVVGVGDEKEKLPMPSDEEIDNMYALSEHDEYLIAH